MKKSLGILALFITLSAHTCKDSAGNDTASLLDKKWVFESVNGQKISMPDGVDAPWILVSGERMSGFGGCNNLMGVCKLGDGTVSFPEIGSTKKYCEGIQATETAIKQALGATDAYKMDGGMLKLMGGGKEVAVLKAG